ncbi:MAG TPA: hypothetical protein VFA38_10225 [Nitrospirales bacterium]|nr:hypothetical protein [Nitrospirales bacterium]
MGKLMSAALMIALTVLPSVTLANEPKGGPPDYSGISGLYYSIIALILGYGVYDTFFKKS